MKVVGDSGQLEVLRVSDPNIAQGCVYMKLWICTVVCIALYMECGHGCDAADGEYARHDDELTPHGGLDVGVCVYGAMSEAIDDPVIRCKV